MKLVIGAPLIRSFKCAVGVVFRVQGFVITDQTLLNLKLIGGRRGEEDRKMQIKASRIH